MVILITMENTGRLRLLTHLPVQLVQNLRSLSAAGGVTEGTVVEMILREFFDQLAPQERLEFIRRRV